jgi:hypothetical protein
LRILEHLAHPRAIAAAAEIIILVSTARAQFHHGELGRDEESVEQKERHHGEQTQAGTVSHFRQSGS